MHGTRAGKVATCQAQAEELVPVVVYGVRRNRVVESSISEQMIIPIKMAIKATDYTLAEDVLLA